MISDFHHLAEKVGQLAELTQLLRRENAELRLAAAALTEENQDLSQRMEDAHRRVSALLDAIPAAEESEESGKEAA